MGLGKGRKDKQAVGVEWVRSEGGGERTAVCVEPLEMCWGEYRDVLGDKGVQGAKKSGKRERQPLTRSSATSSSDITGGACSQSAPPSAGVREGGRGDAIIKKRIKLGKKEDKRRMSKLFLLPSEIKFFRCRYFLQYASGVTRAAVV
jgi:hypothetical protein